MPHSPSLSITLMQMEVVMPSRMTVKDSHDIALVLQHKVEAFDEVERAFVHGDIFPPNSFEKYVVYITFGLD